MVYQFFLEPDGAGGQRKVLVVPEADMDKNMSTLQYCRQWLVTHAPGSSDALVRDIDALLRAGGHEPWPEHARKPQ